MHDVAQAFKQTIVNGLRRKAVTTPSKWAESYRMMGAPIPGPWSFKYHPWLRGVHDAKADCVVVAKAAQMGFTEAVLNVTFYTIDIEGRDCLYVLPSKTPDASDFSSARFDAALQASPHLNNMFSDTKNVGHKRAGTSNLYIRGSNSRSGLKSIPVSFLVFDELDEMKKDNIPLAEERMSGQMQAQMFKISTPTIPNKGISAAYNNSTQDHFMFPCPHCGRWTELTFPESIVITADVINDPRIKESHLICKECHGVLPHETKHEWLADAEWQSTQTSDVRGVHIPQMYSSAKFASPPKLAELFLRAQTDPFSEQEFYNSKLGKAFVAEGAQVTDHQLDAVLGPRRKADKVPENYKLITMGVDQGRWLHCEVDAWSFTKYGNDLNMNAVPEVLWEGKVQEFKELYKLMSQWQVNACVIDAQPERRLAYEFACEFWGYVKLCFYSTGASGRMINVGDTESHKVSVDRTTWLDTALNRFHTKTITLPCDTSLEYRDHIKNLVRRYTEDNSGNPVARYDNMGPDHFGHARCYAEIALPIAASITTNSDIKGFL